MINIVNNPQSPLPSVAIDRGHDAVPVYAAKLESTHCEAGKVLLKNPFNIAPGFHSLRSLKPGRNLFLYNVDAKH
ncbi:MAG: hypothetical protein DRN71_05725 [Candidatus Nanohalarchaeota archaeon]|nr:MAG: hypothetical protein DRN71_05725 [Candidatus Nanohaloarchaeota archaeon]